MRSRILAVVLMAFLCMHGFATDVPTKDPTSEPTTGPTMEPTRPTANPTMEPTIYPTMSPTLEPSDPTMEPTIYPTMEPTIYPTGPTADPTVEPTVDPTTEPTSGPTNDPTMTPTTEPTRTPTTDPTTTPTTGPSTDPTTTPTTVPSTDPTIGPTIEPSTDPTSDPTMEPTTAGPTTEPTVDPTNEPTVSPSPEPTTSPTNDPTNDPTIEPTTASPTDAPTDNPTALPTPPTLDPTIDPTMEPTQDPTIDPTIDPTSDPTMEPTTPTTEPTTDPTLEPTTPSPTTEPTLYPTTATDNPTVMPTMSPVTTYDVEIIITINFTVTNASHSDIEALVWDLILDEILLILPDITEAELDQRTQLDIDDSDKVYTFEVTVTIPDEASADSLVMAVHTEAFISDLEEYIESETNNVIANNGISSEAAATANDDGTDNGTDGEEEVDWLDPTTYKLLNWIVVGTGGCMLVILACCVLKCCCLCFCSESKEEKKRSQHRRVDSSQPLFQQVSVSRDTKTNNAFNSDLSKAIELQKRGNFLKKTASKAKLMEKEKANELDLNGHQIAAAFDMNFDERAPMAAEGDSKPKHVSKQDSSDMESQVKEIQSKKRNKSGSKEKGRPSLVHQMTPGGPTPGGPDEDDHPPPAPDAPPINDEVMTQEEAEAAYDLL